MIHVCTSRIEFKQMLFQKQKKMIHAHRTSRIDFENIDAVV